jgi:hypothetical protein
VLFADALRLAPCHNLLCGNMSPLTASVNESSVGESVVFDALVVATKVLEIALVTESVESLEPDAHAVNTTTMVQNLISRCKCARNKFENIFLSLWV